MNRAIAWIEQHLRDEIEWDAAAREADCSTFHFLRMFEVTTGITAGEYVRRRRLPLAAMDLATGDSKNSSSFSKRVTRAAARSASASHSIAYQRGVQNHA